MTSQLLPPLFPRPAEADIYKDSPGLHERAKTQAPANEEESLIVKPGERFKNGEVAALLESEDAPITVPDSHGPLSSPLNAAIAAGRLTNVKVLLSMPWTDPNGFPRHHFSRASNLFLRYRPDWVKGGDDFLSFPTREEMMSGCSRADFAQNHPGWNVWRVANSAKKQAGPLIFEELTERRAGRSRFWAAKDFPQMKAGKYGQAMAPLTAIELAARCGRVDFLENLVLAGADTQAWLKTNTRPIEDGIPIPASTSFLSVSTPLHGAIDAQNAEMLVYLLEKGHNPDFFPPAIITRSLSATMHAISQARSSSGSSSTPGSEDRDVWPQGLEMLLAETDFTKRTPIFNCHCLHIAAATLDLGVFLKVLQVATPRSPNLFGLEATVLQHTPLHVACLPLDDTVINLHSRAIHQSIHDVRTLGEDWKPCRMQPYAEFVIPEPGAGARETIGFLGSKGGLYSPRLGDYTSDYAETLATVEDAISRRVQAEHEAQYQLVKFLLEVCYDHNPLAALTSQDIHGNTPWHYLASCRDFNVPLCSYLEKRGLGIDQRVLSTIKNDWGYTARQLADANTKARNWQTIEGYWPFWDDVISGGKNPKFE